MVNVLGTVILYNPSEEIILNIKSYADQISELLIIDNSDRPHNLQHALRASFPGHHYIKNETNVGIATALNQAANYGVERKYRWLLTMDQDSRFAEDGSILCLISKVNQPSVNIGIYTPVHLNKDSVLRKDKPEWEVVKKTMTSGNLLSLEAFVECGPFDEKLFIDYVDHEYNYRLRKNGFQIVRMNQSILIHNLGEIKSYRFYFIKMKTTNHSAIRRYYIARNRLYVIFKYFRFDPAFFFKELRKYWVDYFRVLFFDKDKMAKLKAMAEGTRDWALGRYGKKIR